MNSQPNFLSPEQRKSLYSRTLWKRAELTALQLESLCTKSFKQWDSVFGFVCLFILPLAFLSELKIIDWKLLCHHTDVNLEESGVSNDEEQHSGSTQSMQNLVTKTNRNTEKNILQNLITRRQWAREKTGRRKSNAQRNKHTELVNSDPTFHNIRHP
jgi:hypothetical protein